MRVLLGLLLLALIPTLAGSQPAPAPTSLSLAKGWDFWLDPTDSGLQRGWQAAGPTLPPDREIATGAGLDEQGIRSYKGTAWYRKRVLVPAAWHRDVIGFGALDVQCDLYVNGSFMGHFEDKTLGQRAATVDLTEVAPPGSQATIVVRLLATGGAGGIKQEVKLGQDESQVMSGEQYVLFLHQQHPDWRLPAWAMTGRKAWVVTAVEGAASKAIVALDGSFSPWAGAYSVTFWLFDPVTSQLVDFPPPLAELADGSSPLPVFTFARGPWRLREELAAYGPPSQPAVAARLTLTAGPNDALLFAAARPYGASSGTVPVHRVQYATGALHVDGSLALSCVTCAGVQGGALTLRQAAAGPAPAIAVDASVLAAQGVIPLQALAASPEGWAQGLMRVPLAAGGQLTLLAPGAAVASVPPAPDFARLSAAWQSRLHSVQLDLPDATLQRAYYASLAYVLADQHSGVVEPGPLLHDRFWVRDAAMIGYALDRSGLSGSMEASANAILRAIAPDGMVTSVADSAGKPLFYGEFDAPGQAAFGLVEYARFSGDHDFLSRAYPSIVAALRRAMANRDETGLVPPNVSAEDLGSPTQHHYWDDFWLLTGLADGRWAALQLGRTADAAEFQRDDADLRHALTASIDATGADFIPNGPEDLDSSAMARGSSVALWPVHVLDPDLTLVRRSFDTYYKRFVEPDGGAYHHLYGQWWPYGGLELAHDFLFLGQRDRVQQILGYTLNHQTAPGLFAWAEGVDPATGAFAEGDMPHAWSSAELVNLVRDMLLYEDGDHLVIGAGVPAEWRGQAFSAHGLPTIWGVADLDVGSDGSVRVSGITPPGGIKLDLPFPAYLAN